LFGFFAVSLLLLGLAFWQGKNDSLEVIFFDVGQGDSILIKTPSHHNILIDGGPDAMALAKIGRTLPFYDQTIDLMVLTHAHSDHVAGLVEVLKRYEVEQVLYTGVDDAAADFKAWEKYIDKNGIEMTIAQAGQIFQFGEVNLEVLYPLVDISHQKFEDLNDSSIVARVVYQDNAILLTGDAPVSVEEEILASGAEIGSDILKVGHHGSKYSSSREFLEAVDSEYAVIQSGKGNKFGHPHLLTLRKLESMGAEILRNDELGDIKFVCDTICQLK